MENIPPLPAGWTRDRVYASSGAEMAALHPADYAMIREYIEAESSNTAASAHASDTSEEFDPAMSEELAAIAAEVGLHVDDLTGGFADVAHTMVNDGLDVWGFVLLKTWGYGRGAEAEIWTRFWQRWVEFMDEQLRANGATGDLRTGLAGKLQWMLIEDERLAGASIEQVRRFFAEMAEDEERFPNGLDLDMCLAIDEESVKSLLITSEDSVPFVTGVARELDEEEDSNGFFKIAMDTLIPDVWYLLTIMPPGQLDPGDGMIYRGFLTGRDLDEMDTDEDDSEY